MDISLLWIPATLAAAAAQTARNATQRRLTETLGTVGATQVRFLYGLPFAALFLLIVLAVSGERLPRPGSGLLRLHRHGGGDADPCDGAHARRHARALLFRRDGNDEDRAGPHRGLRPRGPGRPADAADGGWRSSSRPPGVILASLKSGLSELTRAGARPILMGVVAGAFFGLAATGFRGAILSLDSGSFVVRASTTLVCGLALQTAILVAWLVAFNRPALVGSLQGVALVPVRRLPRRARLAVLVHRLCPDGGRQCAHARPRRGADGAGRLAPASRRRNHPPGASRHRPDRRRRRSPAVGGGLRLCTYTWEACAEPPC